MNILLKSHKDLTEDDFSQLWEKGLFIFDTNILLDLYRLPISAQEDLLNILSSKKINRRVWLPFQVLLEFTNNRLDAISDQKNKFNIVKNIIKEGISETNNVYNGLLEKLNKLQLKKRHSAINPDTCINPELFEVALESLNKFLGELDKLENKQPDVNDKDELNKKILKMFEGKIGSGFTKQELEEIFKEGELRYKENIPPGFKDRDKEGFYLFEDKKYIRKYGDLVAWKEIIKEVKEKNHEYVILVTGDTKEDWWQEKRGKKLGPRYELLNEIYFSSSNLKVFHMYDTSGFMQYAKHNLKIDIKEQSIKETKDLIEYNKLSEQKTKRSPFIHSIKNFILHIGRKFPILINFTTGFENSPQITVPVHIMEFILMEIFTNVTKHASEKEVSVRVSTIQDFLVVKFTNKMDKTQFIAMEFKGKGIEYIKSLFEPNFGFILSEVTNDNLFQIAICIKDEFINWPNKIITLN